MVLLASAIVCAISIASSFHLAFGRLLGSAQPPSTSSPQRNALVETLETQPQRALYAKDNFYMLVSGLNAEGNPVERVGGPGVVAVPDPNLPYGNDEPDVGFVQHCGNPPSICDHAFWYWGNCRSLRSIHYLDHHPEAGAWCLTANVTGSIGMIDAYNAFVDECTGGENQSWRRYGKNHRRLAVNLGKGETKDHWCLSRVGDKKNAIRERGGHKKRNKCECRGDYVGNAIVRKCDPTDQNQLVDMVYVNMKE